MSQNEIICNNCQNVNEPNSLFCASCGTKLEEINEVKLNEEELINKEKEAHYQKALLLFTEGDFEEAIDIFAELGNFRDAPDKIKLARTTQEKHKEEIMQREHERKEKMFAVGIEAFSIGNLDQAEQIFSELSDYPEAEEKLYLVRKAQQTAKEKENEAYYHKGLDLFSSGQLDQAQEIFTYLGTYRDSQSKLELIQQSKAAVNQSNYQNQVNQLLQQGYETTESKVVGQVIGRLQELGFNGKELVELEQKYHSIAQADSNQKEVRAKKIKIIVGVVASILVVCGLIGGVVYYRLNEAKQLATAVEKQRSTNEASFSELEEGIQGELKDMLSSYGANTRDYTYKTVEETADYTLITYTFKGPDDSKDLLPQVGTRLYNSIAFTRE